MYPSNIFAISLAGLVGLAAAQTTTDPVTGILGNATVVTNNPPGIGYKAVLPTVEFNNPTDPRGNIKGFVTAVANNSGIGVDFKVSFSNLPTSGGPFLYHIHVAPVPADGNCTNTLAHLDPFIRGETPVCDPELPQTCQVGDLSGKYGRITSDPFVAEFTDDFASTVSGLGSFFGNRSIVVHFANKTRITCANFTLAGSSGASNGTSGNLTTTATATSTAPITQTSTPITFTGIGASSTRHVSLIVLLSAVGVAFLL